MTQGNKLKILEFALETIATAVVGIPEGRMCRVQVINQQAGLKVTQTLSESATRCYIWAAKDTLCPELFISKVVPTEQSAQWQRKYQFEAYEY